MLRVGEAEFLLMRARRVLNLQQDAEKRGEEYHPSEALHDLSCGYAASIALEKKPDGQYRRVVTIGVARIGAVTKPTEEEVSAVAEAILKGPVQRLPRSGQVFVLTSEA